MQRPGAAGCLLRAEIGGELVTLAQNQHALQAAAAYRAALAAAATTAANDSAAKRCSLLSFRCFVRYASS